MLNANQIVQRRTQVKVTEIPFAIRGGIVLLNIDSILLQSDIIFVVSSDKSLCVEETHRKFTQMFSNTQSSNI